MLQLLTESLRLKYEYHFDKLISDTFLDNHFDASHNTFQTIRRVADVYEWGNNVLLPGLFANAGPCSSPVGQPGHFESAIDRAGATDLATALAAKGCNDDTWPDGQGSFHLEGSTGWTPDEVCAAFDVLDWTEGIVFKQVRVAPQSAASCSTMVYGTACLPEVQAAHVDTEPFGHNWTDPSAPLQHQWTYYSPEELGSNPEGIVSAAVPSFRVFETGGYVAIVLPFMATRWLPEQRGTHEEVIDHRAHMLNRTDASGARPQTLFHCVRLSWNGRHIHQLCDPNDAEGRTTGVVRLAVEEFFNDLKRGHFIDRQTRMVSITMALRSNHLAVRSRVTLMLETTATGTLLPSYDIEARVESPSKLDQTKLWGSVALCMCGFFVALEVVELASSGLSYFLDPWNLMDGINFFIFFLTWLQVCARAMPTSRAIRARTYANPPTSSIAATNGV